MPKAGTLLAGKTLKGGLVYAGVNGAPTQQGDPMKIKPAPRVGATFAMDAKTVIRGGYGLFWAPWNYSTNGARPDRFLARRRSSASRRPESEVPLSDARQSVPERTAGADRQLAGPADQRRRAGRLHRSEQGQPEGPPVFGRHRARAAAARWRSRIGYIGATGRDIGFCGTNEGDDLLHQHQPDRSGGGARSCSRSAAAGMRRSCASRCPIRSSASPRQASSARSPTIPRGQLLRPFPEFGDVLVHESTAGSKRQYHAVSFKLDKRLSGSQNWWGGRFSYTWSRSKDNQFGESNTYAWTHAAAAEQLRSRRRIRDQHLQLAAPDHPGADRPAARPEEHGGMTTRCSAAGMRRRSSSW